jgi:Phospholipase_D-nuclease N-terminal/Short C-terminal domain
MVLAYDYPLLSIFWSMLIFFFWVIWLITLFHVISDVFRSHELGGFAKAAWLILVIVAPFLGVLAYLIFRGDDMARHAVADAEARDAQFKAYVRETAGTSGPGDQLTQLAALRDAGHITDAEYEAGKAKVLA